MKNYQKLELGQPSTWNQSTFAHEGIELPGKRFVQTELGLTGSELSVNGMSPGESMPALHKHKTNEEVYLFIGGHGQFVVDGEQFDVGPGSIVRVDPAGARAWRNNGTEELLFVVFQTSTESSVGPTISDGELLSQELVWK